MSDITTRFVWDLDCTYLQTDIESLSGMVRAAFEAPAEKKAYPGAKTVLRALKRVSSHRLHILSGSPRQLRPTLEEKLALDGVMWDAFEEINLDAGEINLDPAEINLDAGEINVAS